MNVENPTQPQHITLDSLQIQKKVGEGKFTVYRVHSASQQTDYALKAFPKDPMGLKQFQKESIMFKLSHPNIIQYIPTIQSETFKFYGVVTEFAKYGDLFDHVVGGVFNSETLIRTYFHQLIAGLEYIHSQGIAHLDLKLENLLLGSDFTLKIIDFDQAQPITDKVLAAGGTTGFRAPEVISGSCKDFVAADVYSAGVILFAFKAVGYPFPEVTTAKQGTTLKHYSKFMQDNKSFWEMKARIAKDPAFFSEDFKELINGMLRYEVDKRFSLEDVKKSKWYNGPILNQESIKVEMKNRLMQAAKK